MPQVALPDSPARIALLHCVGFLILVLISARVFAGSVTLAWDPVNSPALAGYFVHYGPTAGNYTVKVDVGNTTMRTAFQPH